MCSSFSTQQELESEMSKAAQLHSMDPNQSLRAYYQEFKKVSWPSSLRDHGASLPPRSLHVLTISILVHVLCIPHLTSQVVEGSDVVLEVLDARDPLGCRCFQVEQAILSSGTNKKLILVLNKIGQFALAHPLYVGEACNSNKCSLNTSCVV